MRPLYELADVIGLVANNSPQFFKQLPKRKQQVFHRMAICRTAQLGAHNYKCNSCDFTQIAYNSCRDRHCTKCQATQREDWITKQQERTLPVSYFHVVFTIPAELNPLCLAFPKEIYTLLYKASWKTLKQLADQKQMLMGMTAILHTWGQNLSLHPHLHCMVPCLQQNKKRKPFLFPVSVISTVFKGIFLKELKKMHEKQTITWHKFHQLKESLYNKQWVVYAKRPFLNETYLIEYLGRYTYKVAISNHRIKALDQNNITFSYKDYKDAAKTKSMTLENTEFLRRFKQHILPKGFVRIRHFGLHANKNKGLLENIRMNLTKVKKKVPKQIYPIKTTQQIACPICKASMQNMGSYQPINKGSPKW